MKQIHILLVFLTILLCWGCGASETPTPREAEESKIQETEHVSGIFEGLEDNHTAVFSFDGIETAFYFDKQNVQEVLYQAVVGSSYTLSYRYDDSLGYIIYEISE